MTEIENGISLCTDDDDVDFYSGPTRIRCEDADDDDEDIILPNRSGSLATRRPLSVMRSVYDAPDFVKRIPSAQEVQAGDEIRFQCTIVGFPTPSVHWYHDEEEITDDPRYEFPCDLSTGTFACILESATKHDEGAYKCKATNSEGSSSSTGFVTVISDHKRSKSPRRAPKRGVSYPTPFNTISEVTSDGEKEEDQQLQIRTQNYYNSLLAKERESNSPRSRPSSSGDIFVLDKDNEKSLTTQSSEDVRQRLSRDSNVKSNGFMGMSDVSCSGENVIGLGNSDIHQTLDYDADGEVEGRPPRKKLHLNGNHDSSLHSSPVFLTKDQASVNSSDMAEKRFNGESKRLGYNNHNVTLSDQKGEKMDAQNNPSVRYIKSDGFQSKISMDLISTAKQTDMGSQLAGKSAMSSPVHISSVASVKPTPLELQSTHSSESVNSSHLYAPDVSNACAFVGDNADDLDKHGMNGSSDTLSSSSDTIENVNKHAEGSEDHSKRKPIPYLKARALMGKDNRMNWQSDDSTNGNSSSKSQEFKINQKLCETVGKFELIEDDKNMPKPRFDMPTNIDKGPKCLSQPFVFRHESSKNGNNMLSKQGFLNIQPLPGFDYKKANGVNEDDVSLVSISQLNKANEINTSKQDHKASKDEIDNRVPSRAQSELKEKSTPLKSGLDVVGRRLSTEPLSSSSVAPQSNTTTGKKYEKKTSNAQHVHQVQSSVALKSNKDQKHAHGHEPQLDTKPKPEDKTLPGNVKNTLKSKFDHTPLPSETKDEKRVKDKTLTNSLRSKFEKPHKDEEPKICIQSDQSLTKTNVQTAKEQSTVSHDKSKVEATGKGRGINLKPQPGPKNSNDGHVSLRSKFEQNVQDKGVSNNAKEGALKGTSDRISKFQTKDDPSFGTAPATTKLNLEQNAALEQVVTGVKSDVHVVGGTTKASNLKSKFEQKDEKATITKLEKNTKGDESATKAQSKPEHLNLMSKFETKDEKTKLKSRFEQTPPEPRSTAESKHSKDSPARKPETDSKSGTTLHDNSRASDLRSKFETKVEKSKSQIEQAKSNTETKNNKDLPIKKLETDSKSAITSQDKYRASDFMSKFETKDEKTKLKSKFEQTPPESRSNAESKDIKYSLTRNPETDSKSGTTSHDKSRASDLRSKFETKDEKSKSKFEQAKSNTETKNNKDLPLKKLETDSKSAIRSEDKSRASDLRSKFETKEEKPKLKSKFEQTPTETKLIAESKHNNDFPIKKQETGSKSSLASQDKPLASGLRSKFETKDEKSKSSAELKLKESTTKKQEADSKSEITLQSKLKSKFEQMPVETKSKNVSKHDKDFQETGSKTSKALHDKSRASDLKSKFETSDKMSKTQSKFEHTTAEAKSNVDSKVNKDFSIKKQETDSKSTLKTQDKPLASDLRSRFETKDEKSKLSTQLKLKESTTKKQETDSKSEITLQDKSRAFDLRSRFETKDDKSESKSKFGQTPVETKSKNESKYDKDFQETGSKISKTLQDKSRAFDLKSKFETSDKMSKTQPKFEHTTAETKSNVESKVNKDFPIKKQETYSKSTLKTQDKPLASDLRSKFETKDEKCKSSTELKLKESTIKKQEDSKSAITSQDKLRASDLKSKFETKDEKSKTKSKFGQTPVETKSNIESKHDNDFPEADSKTSFTLQDKSRASDLKSKFETIDKIPKTQSKFHQSTGETKPNVESKVNKDFPIKKQETGSKSSLKTQDKHIASDLRTKFETKDEYSKSSTALKLNESTIKTQETDSKSAITLQDKSPPFDLRSKFETTDEKSKLKSESKHKDFPIKKQETDSKSAQVSQNKFLATDLRSKFETEDEKSKSTTGLKHRDSTTKTKNTDSKSAITSQDKSHALDLKSKFETRDEKSKVKSRFEPVGKTNIESKYGSDFQKTDLKTSITSQDEMRAFDLKTKFGTKDENSKLKSKFEQTRPEKKSDTESKHEKDFANKKLEKNSVSVMTSQNQLHASELRSKFETKDKSKLKAKIEQIPAETKSSIGSKHNKHLPIKKQETGSKTVMTSLDSSFASDLRSKFDTKGEKSKLKSRFEQLPPETKSTTESKHKKDFPIKKLETALKSEMASQDTSRAPDLRCKFETKDEKSKLTSKFERTTAETKSNIGSKLNPEFVIKRPETESAVMSFETNRKAQSELFSRFEQKQKSSNVISPKNEKSTSERGSSVDLKSKFEQKDSKNVSIASNSNAKQPQSEKHGKQSSNIRLTFEPKIDDTTLNKKSAFEQKRKDEKLPLDTKSKVELGKTVGINQRFEKTTEIKATKPLSKDSVKDVQQGSSRLATSTTQQGGEKTLGDDKSMKKSHGSNDNKFSELQRAFHKFVPADVMSEAEKSSESSEVNAVQMSSLASKDDSTDPEEPQLCASEIKALFEAKFSEKEAPTPTRKPTIHQKSDVKEMLPETKTKQMESKSVELPATKLRSTFVAKTLENKPSEKFKSTKQDEVGQLKMNAPYNEVQFKFKVDKHNLPGDDNRQSKFQLKHLGSVSSVEPKSSKTVLSNESVKVGVKTGHRNVETNKGDNSRDSSTKSVSHNPHSGSSSLKNRFAMFENK